MSKKSKPKDGSDGRGAKGLLEPEPPEPPGLPLPEPAIKPPLANPVGLLAQRWWQVHQLV